MFYRMIEKKRDQWYASPDCTIQPLIAYMEKRGQMRDAQIDAIKTYLYLKIACQSASLSDLFSAGAFNTLDLDALPLTADAKEYLSGDPAAAALLEYAQLKNDEGEQVSSRLEEQLKAAPQSIDCRRVFQDIFYGVSYTDYLFSLPMGAGKTYLMAAFIYLDLYFAANEPSNRAFAHNFIIFAPSGLKSSVVPSLKTIQNFDPSWVIPEPAATNIKRSISFEVLDQGKTASRSNKTKNPNVQKIAAHQPFSDLFGLVAITNAEKVILDRVEEEGGQINWFEDSDDDRDRQANELRNMIGKLPSLSIFIDEVHHAVSNADKTQERKLRAVVTRWTESGAINSVIGFSGTPYLEKAEKTAVTDKLSVATAEITNTVYYYPLVNGVGNFLKRPVVKISDVADSARIIDSGVREFLDTYKDTVYSDGTTAKLGIYCGTIVKLEELVYPLVSGIVSEYGLSPSCILRFYRESSSKDPAAKKYKAPADSQMLFDTLDKSISPIRIVLLVQIGKEGWDCRSLTGIILSQEGDCPTNMVLQTSCRCLRQVDKSKPETALIYLNDDNGEKLIAQLQKQQHISLKEFTSGGEDPIELKRYDRTVHLRLPQVDFYQLRVSYETAIKEEPAPAKYIPHAADDATLRANITRTASDLGDLTKEQMAVTFDDAERGTERALFSAWLYRIVKGSFGTLSMDELKAHGDILEQVFNTVTYESNGGRCFSSKYDLPRVEANIRKAFCEQRAFTTKEELIPEEASLLNIANFQPTIQTDDPQKYYPEQAVVENIILDDKGKFHVDPEIETTIRVLEETGNHEMAESFRRQHSSHPQKDRSFHYLPYHTDSGFEQAFLQEVLAFDDLSARGLEVYYNGDRAMTEFKIRCYKAVGGKWRYIGMYTPDFLIIQRRDGKIHKALIVETKGKIYANDPTFKDKRAFMDSEFIRQNNEKFGYERFDYLYLEDSIEPADRLVLTHEKIKEFFGEGL